MNQTTEMLKPRDEKETNIWAQETSVTLIDQWDDDNGMIFFFQLNKVLFLLHQSTVSAT